MTTQVQTVASATTRTLWLRRAVAVLAGALLVTLGAQVAVPVPGIPVPITLQVPAVLIVGGVLGPALGVSSLVLYLLMGVAGLPVFAPGGVLGFARLLGPTGGYLLAMPLAAGVTGRLVGEQRTALRIAAAVVAGVLLVHAGGVAQLAVLGGDLGIAVRAGSAPFLAGDGLKLVFAGLIIYRFAPPTRRALR